METQGRSKEGGGRGNGGDGGRVNRDGLKGGVRAKQEDSARGPGVARVLPMLTPDSFSPFHCSLPPPLQFPGEGLTLTGGLKGGRINL